MSAETGVVAAMIGLALVQMQPPLFDPIAGYRLTQYRGVIPAPPEGIVRVDGAAARSLWQSHRAIFVDASPAPGAVRDAQTGTWALAEAHRTIPGAHWFPESGRGVPADGIGPWLERGVRRLQRNRRIPVVVFCYADCWMSWNAALRLHRARIRDVRWFAEGLDGWRDMDLPTVDAVPER